jgi:hypothetical protein
MKPMEYTGVYAGEEALSIGSTLRIGKRELQHRGESHLGRQ